MAYQSSAMSYRKVRGWPGKPSKGCRLLRTACRMLRQTTCSTWRPVGALVMTMLPGWVFR
jgi:hypothetical protein